LDKFAADHKQNESNRTFHRAWYHLAFYNAKRTKMNSLPPRGYGSDTRR